MITTELEIGYELIADEGKDLVLFDESNNELIRTKEVTIPTKDITNNWVEVDEITLPSLTDEERKAQELKEKIANLEAELARLKELT